MNQKKNWNLNEMKRRTWMGSIFLCFLCSRVVFLPAVVVAVGGGFFSIHIFFYTYLVFYHMRWNGQSVCCLYFVYFYVSPQHPMLLMIFMLLFYATFYEMNACGFLSWKLLKILAVFGIWCTVNVCLVLLLLANWRIWNH